MCLLQPVARLESDEDVEDDKEKQADLFNLQGNHGYTGSRVLSAQQTDKS